MKKERMRKRKLHESENGNWKNTSSAGWAEKRGGIAKLAIEHVKRITVECTKRMHFIINDLMKNSFEMLWTSYGILFTRTTTCRHWGAWSILTVRTCTRLVLYCSSCNQMSKNRHLR